MTFETLVELGSLVFDSAFADDELIFGSSLRFAGLV